MGRRAKEHWLRSRREEIGISQEDLTVRLRTVGIEFARGTIAHWERGTANPPLLDPQFRRGLANALELSPSQLLERAGLEVANRPKTKNSERAADIMDQLPESDQEIVLVLLEAMLKRALDNKNSLEPRLVKRSR